MFLWKSQVFWQNFNHWGRSELRGTGEFFGTKQHGLPEFKIANLFTDMPMLKSVQSVALKIESEDRGLKEEKNKRLRKLVDDKLKQSVSL